MDYNSPGNIKVISADKKLFDEIRISDLLPKIVKIDVEGHEPTVISELMKSTMREDIHYLYFKANKSRYDVAQLIKTLERLGFRKLFQGAYTGNHDLTFTKT